LEHDRQSYSDSFPVKAKGAQWIRSHTVFPKYQDNEFIGGFQKEQGRKQGIGVYFSKADALVRRFSLTWKL
jgi:hypothetical protein